MIKDENEIEVLEEAMEQVEVEESWVEEISNKKDEEKRKAADAGFMDGTPLVLKEAIDKEDEFKLLLEFETLVRKFVIQGLGDIPYEGKILLDKLTDLRQDGSQVIFNAPQV